MSSVRIYGKLSGSGVLREGGLFTEHRDYLQNIVLMIGL